MSFFLGKGSEDRVAALQMPLGLAAERECLHETRLLSPKSSGENSPSTLNSVDFFFKVSPEYDIHVDAVEWVVFGGTVEDQSAVYYRGSWSWVFGEDVIAGSPLCVCISDPGGETYQTKFDRPQNPGALSGIFTHFGAVLCIKKGTEFKIRVDFDPPIEQSAFLKFMVHATRDYRK